MTDATDAVRLNLAGQLAIERRGERFDERQLGGTQARLVFAVLVLERARVLPRDELADIVWGGELPSTWESALRTLVSRARALFVAAGLPGAETLTGTRAGYQLRLPEGAIVDVDEAERLVVAAEEAAGAMTTRERGA